MPSSPEVSGPRPGYGSPHPELAALLGRLTPAARERVTWRDNIPMVVTAYLTPAELPDELVTSIRCIVRVADRIVVCHVPDGQHIWPGGRREPGESHRQTAQREVHEETGWLIDLDDLRPLGFLHLRFVSPQPPDHPYPHPDFLQVVYTAPAHRHADQDPAGWRDLDGWERGHELLDPSELGAAPLSTLHRAFLTVLPAAASQDPER